MSRTPEDVAWEVLKLSGVTKMTERRFRAVVQVLATRDDEVTAEALEVAAHTLKGDTHVPDYKAGRAAIQYLRDRADQYRGLP